MIPIIVSSIIVYKYFDIDIHYDGRFNEYTAKSIKRYFNDNDYSEYYVMIYKKDSIYKELEISRSTYFNFREKWKDSIKINKKSEEIFWNNEVKDALIYTKKEEFSNYFRNVQYLYTLRNVSDIKATNCKLFHRGRTDYLNSDKIIEPRQSLVYGMNNIPDSISKSLSYLSSLDEKFRPILLIWIGKGNSEIKIKGQRNYWNGGNDNEVVFCVGISDTISKKILWSGSFSWANNKDLENYVLKSSFRPGNSLNLNNYRESLEFGYNNGLWSPRDFSSYTFLKLPIKNVIIIFSFLIVIILNLLILYRFFSIKDFNYKKNFRKP